MKKVKSHYKTKENYKELVDMLKEIIVDDSVIIVNIGTDRCIADSLSPIIGTILQENNFPLKVFGTISDPMHALNLERKYKEIKKMYPNNRILSIDACLGNIDDIGSIQLRNLPIKPGRGVGKNLIPIGDWSIVGIIDDSNSDEIFTSRNIRLDLVYGISKVIAEALFEATEFLHNKNNANIKLMNREVAVS